MITVLCTCAPNPLHTHTHFPHLEQKVRRDSAVAWRAAIFEPSAIQAFKAGKLQLIYIYLFSG
jgi:hypothetical protein